MPDLLRPPGFQQAVLAEFGTVPKRYLAATAVLALCASVFSVVVQDPSQGLLTLTTVAFGCAYLALAYAMTMAMLPHPVGWLSAAKFIGSGLLIVLPAGVVIGSLLLASLRRWDLNHWMIVVWVVALLAVVISSSLLAGWPAMQATSARWISPVEAYQRTCGIRWPLVAAALIGSAISRAVPDPPGSPDLSAALAYALFEAAVATLTTVIMVSVSVAAWRHMTRTSG